ncbi:polysaccharide biosynthesis tyrosine autokinase [Sphingomonas sp. 1185]|uniref:GumC family protein n=1 Tax=Sphingomonas sp. 1185 TaxID=3156411 RepID=UPI00339B03CC
MNRITSHSAGLISSASVSNRLREDDVQRMPALRQYMHVLLRWRYAIIGTIVACVLLGVIITLLMTPKYTAVATIEIARESDKVTNFQGVEQEASIADQEFYQTQYGLLRSRILAERVANQLHLIDDPAFFARFKDQDDSKSAFHLINNRYPANGHAERQRVAAEILLKHVGIDPQRLSRLVNIAFTSSDPTFSAKVANAWAENFIRTNLDRKVQATAYGRDVLSAQLAQLKEKLDQSQRQLVNYASAQKIINLPAQNSGTGTGSAERSIVADDLAALNASLAEATAERIQAEAKFQQAGRAGASPQALTNTAISGLRQRRAELAAEYQRMMIQFEPNYPSAKALRSQIDQLDQSIAREESRVSSSLNSDYRQAEQRERDLRAKVDSLKSQYLDMRRRSIQYNIYQQEVDSNRALYDGLLNRFKEIGVAGGVGVNNISIVDSADVPQKPSSPRLLLNLAISILSGFVLGVVLAFGLEQLDESIVDPAEVERRLGLPLLGSVPKVSNVTPRDALLDRKSDIVDAYLAVHTNLCFTTEHGVPRSLSVTSTRPAEGKSTTALALAAMLARTGRQVILVDGDMRSPSVHTLGGVSHDAGLSNFLAGDDRIDHLIFRMDDLNIAAMTSGPIPPNAAELLTSNRLALLISELLKRYDNVVIDSPPVMGLADAPLIGGRVEGVIYAVESHGIRSTLVRTAISRLLAANAHIVGGVLTKFEARKSHLGYGYDYGYGYGRDVEKSE